MVYAMKAGWKRTDVVIKKRVSPLIPVGCASQPDTYDWLRESYTNAKLLAIVRGATRHQEVCAAGPGHLIGFDDQCSERGAVKETFLGTFSFRSSGVVQEEKGGAAINTQIRGQRWCNLRRSTIQCGDREQQWCSLQRPSTRGGDWVQQWCSLRLSTIQRGGRGQQWCYIRG